MAELHGDGYEQERAAVGALFTDDGRRDPHGVVAALDLPTARFAVVERVLRDPAFLRAGSPGEQPLWQMLGRWLISLDGERHRRLRARFVGLFGPRTVERFRFANACSVCASMPSGIVPVEGSIPAMPEQKIKPPATIA